MTAAMQGAKALLSEHRASGLSMPQDQLGLGSATFAHHNMSYDQLFANNMSMNVFRILADVCHTISKCILIWSIHSNRSSEGVSILTQLMYAIVFVTRYLDLFWVPAHISYWNFSLKIFYIASSVYIIFLMLKVYARTRERETSWRLAAYLNIGALICAPLLSLIMGAHHKSEPLYQVVWSYSIIIEAFCILPQLILLRQTTVPTVIDSYYLVTLGSYRFFYILNWIYKGAHKQKVEPVKIIFGVIQIAFYVDFAWVYYSRQRVKLRGGGLVDNEDLRKGFLVNRFVDNRVGGDEEDAPAVSGVADTVRGKTVNRWGNRGISISANDTLSRSDQAHGQDQTGSANGNLPPPTSFADDEDEEDNFSLDGADDARMISHDANEVLNSDTKWQSNTGR